VKQQTEPQFSGKRVKRGLYRAADGRLLNADVNGSANIGRKVIGEGEFFARLDRSVAATPVAINPLKLSA
jgi:putative transposase